MSQERATDCSQGHRAAARFQFLARGTSDSKCLRHALAHRPLVRNAVLTALVVGTILTAINQGNVLIDGRFPAQLAWKIPLTYSVPYCVSTWAALRISRIG
jgi:hypothetical protein